MGEHKIIMHNRVTEEYFTDPAEAKARAAVLTKGKDAEGISVAVSRNHEWMLADAIWHCVRWTEARPEEIP
jgi:hypothetical protein